MHRSRITASSSTIRSLFMEISWRVSDSGFWEISNMNIQSNFSGNQGVQLFKGLRKLFRLASACLCHLGLAAAAPSDDGSHFSDKVACFEARNKITAHRDQQGCFPVDIRSKSKDAGAKFVPEGVCKFSKLFHIICRDICRQSPDSGDFTYAGKQIR